MFKLLETVAGNNTAVIIVSDDGDFENSCRANEDITLVRSLPELFTKLGYEIDAPNVVQFMEQRMDTLVELVNNEVNDWGLVGDIDRSEIEEIEVKEVSVLKVSAFRSVEEGDPVFVVGTFSVKADVTYSHPDWESALYDSEDKVLIPFDDVSGETEVDFEVEVSIFITLGEDNQLDQIDMLEFRSGDFQYVTLQPAEY